MDLTLRQNQVPSNLSLVFKGLTKRCEQAELPAMTITVQDFGLDQAKLKQYNQFCGFAVDALPLSYLFVATQPIQLLILTDKRAPVRPMGMIHLGVQFEQFGPMHADQQYKVVMKVGEQGHTEKGLEFELVGEFWQQDTLLMRYISRCLLRVPSAGRRPRRAPRGPKVAYQWQAVTDLALLPEIARGYARVSGDYNPIHLHKLMAKPFGFDAPIAHGMYMVAKMLASVTEPLKCASFEFKRPVLMPSQGVIERDHTALRLANDSGKALVEAQLELA